MQNIRNWYFLRLDGALVATGEVERRKEVFSEAFVAARAPREMALFQQARDTGEVDLFLTPACGEFAAGLLTQWESVPCERPTLAGLELLVGHNEITYYMP